MMGRVGAKPRIYAGQPFVKDFSPATGKCPHLYAVQVKAHPDAVKFGQTTNWANRRKAYLNWNLANGDGILRECVFRITELYVDLPALEAGLLASVQYPLRHGREWFIADFDEACRELDRFLCETGFSYEIL